MAGSGAGDGGLGSPALWFRRFPCPPFVSHQLPAGSLAGVRVSDLLPFSVGKNSLHSCEARTGKDSPLSILVPQPLPAGRQSFCAEEEAPPTPAPGCLRHRHSGKAAPLPLTTLHQVDRPRAELNSRGTGDPRGSPASFRLLEAQGLDLSSFALLSAFRVTGGESLQLPVNVWDLCN